MKLHHFTTLVTCAAVLGACSTLSPKTKVEEPAPTIRLALLAQDKLSPGKPISVTAKLNDIDSRDLITDDDLNRINNQSIQVFLIDPTLSDFRAVAPEASKTPGLYHFQFTPKSAEGYRAWADITLKAPDKKVPAQQFPMTDFGARKAGDVSKTESHEANGLGYHFTLSFANAPTLGDEAKGAISVSGGHGNADVSGDIIGFYEDFYHIVHLYPTGKDMAFHFTPAHSGFLKLFMRAKVDGKEIVVPFGITVAKPADAK